MGTPLLSVKNLSTEFRTERGTVKAVDDVSFDLDAYAHSWNDGPTTGTDLSRNPDLADRREFYEKPTQERKRKKAAAVKRHIKRNSRSFGARPR